MEELEVSEVVDRLELEPHPEGGYYRETWRSQRELDADALPDYPGPRSAGTSILYLLPQGEVSEWHRFRSEELWLYHAGNPVELATTKDLDEEPRVERVGPGSGARLQAHIAGDVWQRTEALGGAATWSLFACVVVPGFEFEDFEMVGDDS